MTRRTISAAIIACLGVLVAAMWFVAQATGAQAESEDDYAGRAATLATAELEDQWRDSDGSFDDQKMPDLIRCLGKGGDLVDVPKDKFIDARESKVPMLCDGTVMPGLTYTMQFGDDDSSLVEAWIDGEPHTLDGEGYFVDEDGNRANIDEKVNSHGELVPRTDR